MLDCLQWYRRASKRRKKGDKRSDMMGKKLVGGKRKTRGMAEAKRRPRNFAALLEEVGIVLNKTLHNAVSLEICCCIKALKAAE